MNTQDLSKFGSRERKIAAELLEHWNNDGLPDNFSNENVAIELNTESGTVFLVNADYQVALLNGDNLELWHYCPECGHEGFSEDMAHSGNAECTDFLESIGL